MSARIVTISLDPALDDRLHRESKKRHLAKSALIRLLLAQVLEGKEIAL
jgi:hypothetical protein